MYLSRIIFTILLLAISYTESRQFKPKTPAEFQSAIDSTQPGDTIQLEAIDYEGDFYINHNGEKNQEIKIIG